MTQEQMKIREVMLDLDNIKILSKKASIPYEVLKIKVKPNIILYIP